MYCTYLCIYSSLKHIICFEYLLSYVFYKAHGNVAYCHHTSRKRYRNWMGHSLLYIGRRYLSIIIKPFAFEKSTEMEFNKSDNF